MRPAATIGLVLMLTGMSAAPSAVAQEALPQQAAERELAGYADCVVDRRAYREPVRAFLRTIPGSESFYPASMKAADMTCLNAAAVRRGASKLEMRLQPASFRAALYPALYRNAFARSGPPAGIASLAPLSLSSEFDGDAATLPADYRPLRALGDCVARADPQAAHAMLVATPNARGEDAAVGGLKPALAGCLGAGQTIAFTRADLRATVGEAMFKLATAAAARPAG